MNGLTQEISTMNINNLTINSLYRDTASGLDLVYIGMDIDEEGEVWCCFKDRALLAELALPIECVQTDLEELK